MGKDFSSRQYLAAPVARLLLARLTGQPRDRPVPPADCFQRARHDNRSPCPLKKWKCCRGIRKTPATDLHRENELCAVLRPVGSARFFLDPQNGSLKQTKLPFILDQRAGAGVEDEGERLVSESAYAKRGAVSASRHIVWFNCRLWGPSTFQPILFSRHLLVSSDGGFVFCQWFFMTAASS